jgi:predicted amidophosphoribosyltransferase
VGLSQEQRQENLAGAFVFKPVYLSKTKDFTQAFVVDDVATSGATLREAARVFKKTGVKHVWGITLAHGQ